ncbi:hypothetical protein M885DRAFT_519458 [Pelagophyceae sp. CCMP2097]|nr:hypothetical protein M885DRAFT_519458 [Pelagophyceae sp. CCMP2097]
MESPFGFGSWRRGAQIEAPADEQSSSSAALAHAHALEAERLSAVGDVDACCAAHEAAARGYLQAAHEVRDPTTIRAVALIADAHARRARALRRWTGPRERASPRGAAAPQSTPPGRRDDAGADAPAEPPAGTLCVGDLLALERRLHTLGVGGRGSTNLRGGATTPKLLFAKRDAEPSALLARALGEAWLADADAAKPRPRRGPSEGDCSSVDCAANVERLLRCMRQLSEENHALAAERDVLRETASWSEQAEADVRRFKVQYQQKFEALKEALEKFRREHPSVNNPANALRPAEPAPPKSSSQLERDVDSLQKRLETERALSRKKDAVIERYEHWYAALKAAANRRDGARSSPTPAPASTPTSQRRSPSEG